MPSLPDRFAGDADSHLPQTIRGLSAPRPLSEISSQFAEPTTSSYPHPFSITVTAPSLSSHDSDFESPVEDERDRGDDTGKQSFDFTREINRLNQGGARESFVEQLEAAFRVPDELKSPTVPDYGSQDGSPTALQWDLRDAGSNVSASHHALSKMLVLTVHFSRLCENHLRDISILTSDSGPRRTWIRQIL